MPLNFREDKTVKILLWIWCFPQMLAGLIVKKLSGAVQHKDGHYLYRWTQGSVSLGEYIFLCPYHWENEWNLKHEQGHQKQSRMLGWFYLLVIGIPSIIWAGCFKKYRKKHNVDYYSFYTEKWANKLMNIDD